MKESILKVSAGNIKKVPGKVSVKTIDVKIKKESEPDSKVSILNRRKISKSSAQT